MTRDTPEATATDMPVTGTPDMSVDPNAARPLFQTPRLADFLRNPLYRQQRPMPEAPEPRDRQATAALDDLYATAQALSDATAQQAADLARLTSAVSQALDLLKQAARNSINVSVSLKASQGTNIDTMGYKHCFLLLTAAQSNVVFDIPGVGRVTRNLNADWNRLDYPDKTTIYLAADPASPVNAIIRLTDDIINV